MSAERPDACQPDQIGPYRILETLGEGGMGVVYLAEQRQPIRRRVALKVIKLGMDSRAVLTRFEAERQALALMEHENIAKVLDAGLAENGRPYFAMEYVNGRALTDYCDGERLGLVARLELFQRVCAGVQHAHHKGIIHRDLKPANVLVTRHEGHAVPKIIDFGLARATNHRLVEATLFTEQGQIIGTPEYMSPEQTDLGNHDIDTRTDVYSLGVMLYQLLVGELPFPSDELRRLGLLEVQRVIREVDPPRPSSRVSAMHRAMPAPESLRPDRHAWLQVLRGDLDWIVLRALEKDPDRRYQTPLAFADDLGRHLRNEPVAARPPSMRYRFGKFVRKHRVAVATVALMLATVVLGVCVSLVLLFEARSARTAAELATAASQQQLAHMQMIAIDQAAFWTARSFDQARVPTLEEVQNHLVDGLPVLNGMPLPPRDPWGNPYRLVPVGLPGDWTVLCDGRNGRPGDADDLSEHARMFTVDTQRRLVDLFERRAARLLDLAQELLVLGRLPSDPGQLAAADVLDPWGNSMVLLPDSSELSVRSAGPDGVVASNDDLVVHRELMPVTVAPQDVRAQIGHSRRIYCVVPLQHVTATKVAESLRAALVELGSAVPGLTIGSVGQSAVAFLGPPEQVAILLEQVRQMDRPG